MAPGQRSRASAVASPNIRFVGHSDQGGRSDGVQVMVHRGYAYVGHTFSNGITILDVRDPAHPRVVDFVACPPNTRAIHLQTHEDLLLAVNGPSVWHMQEFQNQQDYFGASPADKLEPRRELRLRDPHLRHLPAGEAARRSASCPSRASGPTASGTRAAATPTLPSTSRSSAITSSPSSTCPIPRKPEVVGRWWIPGMWRAGGETADLAHGQALRAPPRPGGREPRLRRLARRRPDRARRRRSDPAAAARPPELGPAVRRRHPFAAAPAGPRTCSWSPTSRPARTAAQGLRYVWMFDVREPSNPVSIATCPRRPRRTTAPRAATSARTTCTRTGPARSRARA